MHSRRRVARLDGWRESARAWREPPTWHDLQACVARERNVGYDAGESDDSREPPVTRPGAGEHVDSPATHALAALDAALDQLAAVDWTQEGDASVRAASVAMQRRLNRVGAEALRPVEQLEARSAYAYDGAVTAASWLRSRANMDPAVASRTCTAARRLRRLPLLREAFTAGGVSFAHVTAVTEAAVPTRFEAISPVERALVELASTDKPHALRVAIRVVRDAVDPDGTNVEDLSQGDTDAPDDPRRYWRHHLTIDGLYQGEYLVGGILGELISTVFDAFSTPDPAELPLTSRRSPAQKRVDAMRVALLALLNSGAAPTVQGTNAHLLLMIDLLTLMGRSDAAPDRHDAVWTEAGTPSRCARRITTWSRTAAGRRSWTWTAAPACGRRRTAAPSVSDLHAEPA